jgi:hypothetical protein
MPVSTGAASSSTADRAKRCKHCEGKIEIMFVSTLQIIDSAHYLQSLGMWIMFMGDGTMRL